MDMTEIEDRIRHHIDQLLRDHIEDENKKFDKLSADLDEIKREMKAFTEAWQQARGVVTFIKWITSIAGGLIAAILFMKEHWK